MDWANQVSQQNKVADALNATVPAVPGRRAADLGTLQDPNQARSLGWKHWPSKQGVSAVSIGRASKESWLEELAMQARSLGRKHWLSKQGVLAGSIGRASKESQLEALAEQARSLGRKHWQSKQGVSAGSIGPASKESRPDLLVEQ